MAKMMSKNSKNMEIFFKNIEKNWNFGLDPNSATLAVKKVAEKIKISRPRQSQIRPLWPNSATVGNTECHCHMVKCGKFQRFQARFQVQVNGRMSIMSFSGQRGNSNSDETSVFCVGK